MIWYSCFEKPTISSGPEPTIAMVKKLLANVKCQLSMEYSNFW